MIKRIVIRTLGGLCAILLLTFASDYVIFKYRVFKNDNPYGSVTVQAYYAISEKNSRTEYVYKDTEQQMCANSLFPHSGNPPCWYARKHTDKAVPI